MLTKSFCAVALAVTLTPIGFAADSTALSLGSATFLHLPRDAGQVVVGNPAIADVSLQSPRSLALFGKYPGGTTLLVTDQAGKIILQTTLLVAASSANGVTIHYGTGKNWVPGGAMNSAECGRNFCTPAIAVPTDSPYKPAAAVASSPAVSPSAIVAK